MYDFCYFISIYETRCGRYGFVFWEDETFRVVDGSLGNELFDYYGDLVFWLEDSRIGKFMPLKQLPVQLVPVLSEQLGTRLAG